MVKKLLYNECLPTGVQFDTHRNKYVTNVCIAGKKKHIGRFDTLDEAYVKYMLEKNKLIFELVERYYKNGKISNKGNIQCN